MMRPTSANQRRRPAPRDARRRGLVLVECLFYLGVWFIIVGLGFTLFYRALTQWRSLARCADDVALVLEMGETWREEVRQSKVPPRLETDAAGTQWLILNRGQGDVTYRLTGTNVLCHLPGEGEWLELAGQVKRSEFVREQRGGVVAWRWEIELRPRAKRPLLEPLFTFQAVGPQEVAR